MEKQNNAVDIKTKTLAKEFTNVYSLSKTLRFSLIPILPNLDNESMTRQERVEQFVHDYKEEIKNDENRAENYKKLKKYLTELHKIFIKEALSIAEDDEKVKELLSDKKNKVESNKIDFTKLFNLLYGYEVSNDDRERNGKIESINSEKVNLAKKFGDKKGEGGIFSKYMKGVWKVNILSKDVLKVLKEKAEEIAESYNESLLENEQRDIGEIKKEILNLVKEFSGWTTYFANFNEIRANLYKDDGRDGKEGKIHSGNAGQITTRIIDENFSIFVKNVILAESSVKVLKEAGSEVKNIDDLEFSKIFKPEYYKTCFLQTGINTYNKQMRKINSFLNQEAQKLGVKVKFLNKLNKQLLLTDGLEKRPEFKEINTFDDLRQKLFVDGFIERSFEKSKATKGLFKNILEESNEKIEIKNEKILSEIVLDTNKISYYSNLIFGNWNYIKNKYVEFGLDENTSRTKKEEYKKERKTKFEVGVSLEELREVLNVADKSSFIEGDILKGDFQGIDNRGKHGTENNRIVGENFSIFLWNLSNIHKSFLLGREKAMKSEEKEIVKLDRIKEKLKKAKANKERIETDLKDVNKEEYKRIYKESLEAKKNKIFEYKDKDLKNERTRKEFIKFLNEYFDRLINLNKFISLFKDTGIENEFIIAVQEFGADENDSNQFISTFNNVRNFVTQKAEDQDKFKLNFEKPTLMSGWTYPQESHPGSSEYSARILKKDERYYLMIFNSNKKGEQNINYLLDYKIMDYYQVKSKTLLGKIWEGEFNESYKESKKNKQNRELITMTFKLIEKLKKDFPFAKDRIERIEEMRRKRDFDFTITKTELYEKFKELVSNEIGEGIEFSKYKKKKPVKKELALKALKLVLNNRFNDIDLETNIGNKELEKILKKIKDNEKYQGIDKLAFELSKIEPYFYKSSFIDVDLEKYQNKKIWLFEIYNKDFSEKKKPNSKQNLHTLYFKELFSDENQKNPIFKLSGSGEMFFKYALRHERWEEQNLIINKKSDIDKVYKHRRQTHDNIYLHLSIVLNNINKGGNVNQKVCQHVIDNPDLKIIGIDRGEKKLAYQCLLNVNGKIEKIEDLNKTGQNIVNSNKQKINYHDKLDIKENERMLARKSWVKIKGIKDLKKGYISSLVRDIADLMVKKGAFVVLEDLNYGFKRGRIKIEKGIYQQFENALLSKLAYYVPEKTQNGVRNALQLVKITDNQGRLIAQKYWSTQMGSVFYTDAKFTSKTCPNCGFRKRGINLQKIKQIKGLIEAKKIAIYYLKNEDRFRIEYDWSYDTKDGGLSNEDLYGAGVKEIVYSDVERSYFDQKTNNIKDEDPNERLKEIFKIESLDNYQGENLFELLREKIENKEINLGQFITQFNSITKIRYDKKKNDGGKREDVISCPKCGFDSSNDNKNTIPEVSKIENGDANGAYNIARRGLMIYQKIRNFVNSGKTIDKIEKQDLKVDLTDWDKETYRQWKKRGCNIYNK